MYKISNKKNYILTLISSFGGQVLSILLSLISVPISLDYWGEERYGLFAIINSVIVYLSISSLGLNSASSVLMAKNNNFREKIKILKKSFLMIVISIIVFTILFILLNKVTDKWIYFLGKIPKIYFKETYNAMYIMVILFFINTIFSLIDSAFNGFYKVYIQKIFNIFINIFSFGALLLTIFIKGKLYHFVFFIGLVKLIFSIFKIIYFYYFIYKLEKINLEDSTTKIEIVESTYKNILSTGMRFFFIGIAAMVVWNTDNLIIGHFLDIKSVTPYSITFKIYSIIFTVIFILNSSMLPLLAREHGNNNWDWINETYDKLLKIMAIAGGLFWIGGILFLKDFIYLWTGEKGYAGLIVVIALGGYSYLLSMVNINAGIATSFNYTKGIVWIGWIEAILNFIFSIVLLRYFGLGGIATGTFLGSLFGPTIFLPLILKKYSLGKIKYDFKFILLHFIKIILPVLLLSLIVQICITNQVLRVLIGIILMAIYILFSFKMLPQEICFFLIREIRLIMKKVGMKI